MADAICDGTDMMGEFFGKGSGLMGGVRRNGQRMAYWPSACGETESLPSLVLFIGRTLRHYEPLPF